MTRSSSPCDCVRVPQYIKRNSGPTASGFGVGQHGARRRGRAGQQTATRLRSEHATKLPAKLFGASAARADHGYCNRVGERAGAIPWPESAGDASDKGLGRPPAGAEDAPIGETVSRRDRGVATGRWGTGVGWWISVRIRSSPGGTRSLPGASRSRGRKPLGGRDRAVVAGGAPCRSRLGLRAPLPDGRGSACETPHAGRGSRRSGCEIGITHQREREGIPAGQGARRGSRTSVPPVRVGACSARHGIPSPLLRNPPFEIRHWPPISASHQQRRDFSVLSVSPWCILELLTQCQSLP